VAALVNPIEQVDLDSLRTWLRKDPFPCQKLAAEDLPDAFGFDKYGLIVHKEFAADLPELDGTGTTEAPAVPEASSANIRGLLGQDDTTALNILALAASQPSHADSNTDDIIAEVISTFLTEAVDGATPTSFNQSSTSSVKDTAATTPKAPHFPDNSNNANTTPDKPSGLSLRTRKELSYHKPSKGGGASKPKQA
jgi:hypothetical protein